MAGKHLSAAGLSEKSVKDDKISIEGLTVFRMVLHFGYSFLMILINHQKKKKMIKKIACHSVSLMLLVSFSGCSLFVPHKQSITINGNPANAAVIVNGQQYMAPATIRVRRNKNVNIIATKNGYNTFTLQSGFSLSPWGVLDIIGGVCFLVPFFGLLAPGAYELDQDNFYYMLTPAKN